MQILKVKSFIDKESHQIYIDRAFQRKSCWPDDNCRGFILSANKGRTPYPIVVADVNSGIHKSEIVGDAVSKSQFETVKNLKKDWISLDGQNRVQAWTRLFNDDLTLTGDFIDSDGCIVGVKNQYFSSLPIRLQDALKDCEICIHIMKDCLYSELHDTFVAINDGEPLNAQEKRNAINTPISGFIRNLSERSDVHKMLAKVSGFKKQWFARSIDAEWVAIAYIATLGHLSTDAKDKNLDILYKKGRGKDFKMVPEYHAKIRTRFSKILGFLAMTIESSGLPKATNVAQKHFWALLLVAEYIVDNSLDIVDKKSLFSTIVRIDDALSSESSIEYRKDCDLALEKGDEEPSKSSYYFFHRSHVKAAYSRNMRRNILLKRLVSDEEFQSLIEVSEEVA
jgi:hypothetical protein